MTVSRETWLAASAAWQAGEFDEATWRDVRKAAAERGMLFPPAGTRHDDIGDAHPSQRIIVYRAIDSTPERLMAAIGRARSWSDVVNELIRASNTDRTEAELADIADEQRREAARFTERQAAPQRLADIMRRLGER
jgi:hypothetical protein